MIFNAMPPVAGGGSSWTDVTDDFRDLKEVIYDEVQVLSDGHLVIISGRTSNPLSEPLPTGYEPLCTTFGSVVAPDADYANNSVPYAYVDTNTSPTALMLDPAGAEVHFTIIYPIA